MLNFLKRILTKRRRHDVELELPKHLSKAEKKEIREIVTKARKNDGIPRTAQQSIPYDRMFQDGICRLGKKYYTKTVQFEDINYQLATNDDKKPIFDEWCGFLNFFDSSVHFELSFFNVSTDGEAFEKSILGNSYKSQLS